MVKNRSLKTGFCLLTVSWRTIIDPRAVQYVFNWHWVISSPRKLVFVLAVIISLIFLPRSGHCDGLTQRDFQWSFLSVLEVTELNPLFSIRTMRILVVEVVEEGACHIDSVLIISNLRFSFSLSKDTSFSFSHKHHCRTSPPTSMKENDKLVTYRGNCNYLCRWFCPQIPS